jgi:heat shock protein HtpX
MAFLRTTLLMGLLFAIFMAVGYVFAGTGGAAIAFILALAINFFSFWFSDSIVLKMYRAKKYEDGKIKHIVEKLAKKAGVPTPRLYLVDMDTPNAFATGRSPKHSAVAVTKGLMNTLNTEEIEGVLAHEISHIKNRDTLVSTMAATIGGAVSWLAYAFYFGSEQRNALSYIFLVILAPLAAMLVRLAISRAREYGADKTGAMLSNPLHLADALEKIHDAAAARPLRGNSATAHMFIINPFSASDIAGLFSTHPAVGKRIEILRGMGK